MTAKKTMTRYLWLVLMVALSLNPADAQFEGIVETRNVTTDETGNPQNFTITMWIKKDRIRVQTSAFGNTPATTMIYRNDRHIIWMLNEEDRTYFEILQEGRPQGLGAGGGASLEDKPTIRRPGRTKKILGYTCEQVLVTRGEGDTDIWGTKQLSDLAATTSRVLGQSDAEAGGWMDEVARLGLYPLVSSTRIDGKIIESQETTRIETKNLSADLFELPSGFRKQAVRDMQEPPHD
jgi:hypothetical protein